MPLNKETKPNQMKYTDKKHFLIGAVDNTDIIFPTSTIIIIIFKACWQHRFLWLFLTIRPF